MGFILIWEPSRQKLLKMPGKGSVGHKRTGLEFLAWEVRSGLLRLVFFDIALPWLEANQCLNFDRPLSPL